MVLKRPILLYASPLRVQNYAFKVTKDETTVLVRLVAHEKGAYAESACITVTYRFYCL